MASMGVNYAYLHVQQKRLKEKSKRITEEENARSSNNESGVVKKLTMDGKRSKGKKIYPGGFASNKENLGENKE
ncbi:hypothetical protein KY290_003428 [Solanum tuberosum]|uniref:Uncharacterized protein n=1 Tax=Solanum tuberosum TaxID=4113 RepID=A0ABQ7WTF4_SOLTU|nr:hypothetical protein KY284_003595 [Solanum tuberosum]KAH0783830.1 hypothetical protein KY290_003428 [Solanum tuberosum]